MKTRSAKLIHKVKNPEEVFKPVLLTYSVIVLFLTISDAIVAYTVPVYIEKQFGSTTIMGLLLSVSSIAGIIFDFISGKRFSRTTYKTFLVITFAISAVVTSIILFGSGGIVSILVVLVLWGIYYETAAFANFNFINKFIDFKQHNQAWGVINSFKSLAYLLGPVVAIILLEQSSRKPMEGALGFLIFGTLLLFIFLKKHGKKPRRNTFSAEIKQRSLVQEVKIWRALAKTLWPLWIFSFCLILVDSAFWTIGVIFAENLRQVSVLGSLFIAIYMLPQVAVGLEVVKLLPPTGKKRTAFLSSIAAGLLLYLLTYTNNVIAILFIVFVSSIFYAIATTELLAVFEDYVARLGNYGNDLVGYQRTAESLAYILGPILLGFVVTYIGFNDTFAAVGAMLALVAFLLLLLIPKKIKMPQKELLEAAFE